MILTLVKSTLLLKHLTPFRCSILSLMMLEKLLVIKYFLLITLKINQIHCSTQKNISYSISQNTRYIYIGRGVQF